MARRKTAGELNLKASSDRTKYDPREIAFARVDNLQAEFEKCIEIHNKIFDEKEYCVGYVLAKDPLLDKVDRVKFFAYLYLPKPRPNQCIFLYSKAQNKLLKRLWTLPNAKSMAQLSEMINVAEHYKNMKIWCDAFFHGWEYKKKTNTWINTTPTHFFEVIRKQHGIDMLSESEYLNMHREELIKAGCKETNAVLSDPFDFSKVATYKVVDSDAPVSN